MKALRRSILLWAVLVASCTSQPQTTYEDPLAAIGRNVSASAVSSFHTLTLGIVFTDNTRKAMNIVGKTQGRLSEMGVFTNTGAQADADPKSLTTAIDTLLRRRFKDVLVIDKFEDAQAAGADAVMALDIQITMGTHSGTHTHVALQGIFVDNRQQPIGQVKAEGDAVIPYPAFSYQFQPAANQATERFAQAFDGATDLARNLGATHPAVMQAAAPPPSAVPPPVLIAAPAPTLDGKRVALVIGNAGYRNVPRLANTVNDARLVAAALQKIGFTLVGGGPQLDLDRAGFVNAVTSFGNQLAGGSVGVFYYAGHGLQIQGMNYLVPVDANPSKPSDAEVQLVDANLVLHQMEDSGAKLKVMVLDACRNNPFGGRGVRDAGGGLAQIRAPEGTLVSYATQPGNVARDGDAGGDSPYTIALAQAMTMRGMDVLEMFNEVGVLVDNATKGQQQPWVASSPIKGKFYFAGK